MKQQQSKQILVPIGSVPIYQLKGNLGGSPIVIIPSLASQKTNAPIPIAPKPSQKSELNNTMIIPSTVTCITSSQPTNARITRTVKIAPKVSQLAMKQRDETCAKSVVVSLLPKTDVIKNIHSTSAIINAAATSFPIFSKTQSSGSDLSVQTLFSAGSHLSDLSFDSAELSSDPKAFSSEENELMAKVKTLGEDEKKIVDIIQEIESTSDPSSSEYSYDGPRLSDISPIATTIASMNTENWSILKDMLVKARLDKLQNATQTTNSSDLNRHNQGNQIQRNLPQTQGNAPQTQGNFSQNPGNPPPPTYEQAMSTNLDTFSQFTNMKPLPDISSSIHNLSNLNPTNSLQTENNSTGSNIQSSLTPNIIHENFESSLVPQNTLSLTNVVATQQNTDAQVQNLATASMIQTNISAINTSQMMSELPGVINKTEPSWNTGSVDDPITLTETPPLNDFSDTIIPNISVDDSLIKNDDSFEFAGDSITESTMAEQLPQSLKCDTNFSGVELFTTFVTTPKAPRSGAAGYGLGMDFEDLFSGGTTDM